MVAEQAGESLGASKHQATAARGLGVLAFRPSSHPGGPSQCPLIAKGTPLPGSPSLSPPHSCPSQEHTENSPGQWLEWQERKGQGRRPVVHPRSPHLLPIPCQAFLRSSSWLGGGKERLGLVPSPALPQRPPRHRQLDPEGLFVCVQDYRARAAPECLSPLLMGTQKLSTSVSPGTGVILVPECQSRKGLRWGGRGRRGLCHQSLRRQPTPPPAHGPTGTTGFPTPKRILFQRKGLLESGPGSA